MLGKKRSSPNVFRDAKGRFSGDPDYVCGVPAVFTGIVASPEAQAEFDELEKYKLTPDEPFHYEILRLRKKRKDAEDRGWVLEKGKWKFRPKDK